MEIHYCWRCDCEVPLLDEAEWAELSPLADNMVKKIKEHRELTGCNLKEAQIAVANLLLDEFNRIAGFNETNHLAIYHHRRSLFGEKCIGCNLLLRTPKASYCANCGQVYKQNGSA